MGSLQALGCFPLLIRSNGVEKKTMPAIQVFRHRELAQKIAGLTEDIEELKSEKALLIGPGRPPEGKLILAVPTGRDRILPTIFRALGILGDALITLRFCLRR